MSIDWTISIGSIISIGMFIFAAGGFYVNSRNQGKEITEIKNTLKKMEEVVTVVAVQRDQIQSLRETVLQNTKRTDETFTRIFSILDSMRKPA